MYRCIHVYMYICIYVYMSPSVRLDVRACTYTNVRCDHEETHLCSGSSRPQSNILYIYIYIYIYIVIYIYIYLSLSLSVRSSGHSCVLCAHTQTYGPTENCDHLIVHWTPPSQWKLKTQKQHIFGTMCSQCVKPQNRRCQPQDSCPTSARRPDLGLSILDEISEVGLKL